MLYFLASIGIMFILKYGNILQAGRQYVRNLHPHLDELFTCSLCLGFWAGVIVAILGPPSIIFFPFASAAVCWIVDTIQDILQCLAVKLDK